MNRSLQLLRVAVVGAGRMGAHHARIYSQLEGCHLVAVVDKDFDRARKIANDFGGTPVVRLSDIAADIDAASVAVPTVYHAEVAIPLLERGVGVLVEKPLAADSATARQLVEASRKSGSLLQVGHSERFNPVVQAMLRMEVTPRFIETHRISPFTFRSADIGVVFDMMIHDIDIVLHLARTRECTIDAVGVPVLGKHEDVANARIRFANGVIANLTASRLALKTERKLRVFCPTAYLSMDFQAKSGIAIKLADNMDLIKMARERNFEDLSQMAAMDFGSMIKVEPLVVDNVEPLRAEIGSFVEAVRSRGRDQGSGIGDRQAAGTKGASGAGVTAEEGLAAVELAERVTNAIREQDWGKALLPTD